MTHLMQTNSKYRELYQPSRSWRSIQIENNCALPPSKDVFINGDEPRRWIIIVETRHEAWFWDPGASREDKNKYWFRVEFNHHLDSRWDNRLDMKDWEQGFILERGKKLSDWQSTCMQCIEFEKRIVNNS